MVAMVQDLMAMMVAKGMRVCRVLVGRMQVDGRWRE
jgi:hypothetical protein